jgi:hypothetical protein
MADPVHASMRCGSTKFWRQAFYGTRIEIMPLEVREDDSNELKVAIERQDAANMAFEQLSLADKFTFLKIERVQVLIISATGMAIGLIFSLGARRQNWSDLIVGPAYAAEGGSAFGPERQAILFGLFICLILCFGGVFFARTTRVSKFFESIVQVLVGAIVGTIAPK